LPSGPLAVVPDTKIMSPARTAREYPMVSPQLDATATFCLFIPDVLVGWNLVWLSEAEVADGIKPGNGQEELTRSGSTEIDRFSALSANVVRECWMPGSAHSRAIVSP